MKTVVYLDILLLVNFCMALFLLLSAGLLCHSAEEVPRLLVGAGAAAASTLILFAPKLPFLVQLAYQAVSAALCVRLTWPHSAKRQYFRLFGWFYLLNMAVAGAVILAVQSRRPYGVETNNFAVYLDIPPGLLIECVAAVWLVLRVLTACLGLTASSESYSLRVELEQGSFVVRARHDTGYVMFDPLSGVPTLLVCYPSVRLLLPESLAAYLAHFFSEKTDEMPVPEPSLHLRFLEIETVSGQKALPAVPAKIRFDTKNLPVGSMAAAVRNAAQAHRILLVFCGQAELLQGTPALFGTDLLRQAE